MTNETRKIEARKIVDALQVSDKTRMQINACRISHEKWLAWVAGGGWAKTSRKGTGKGYYLPDNTDNNFYKSAHAAD